MTSSVTSSSRKDQQVACIQMQEKRRRREEISSRKLLFISRCYLKIAIAKRCRLHKLIRQRFALALKIQQEDFALLISADEATVNQSQRKDIQTQLMNQTNEEDNQQQLFVQTVGSQYYRSAVGLVFMESAVELAMETSRVDSVDRNQVKAKKSAGS
ncbi:hypothetical protein F511_42416 [Dorcoceras hygrometricum]|uniref:Uncharacterized protein n=1 Tax=Dorcoceras hygrometricum TaxID=472368 RepID=A0A2Z7C8W6_9LAMI|nr:hypothetical protein F511_42416 [Dorcoceras hygrometricum]